MVILHKAFSLLVLGACRPVPLLTFLFYHLRGILSTPLSIKKPLIIAIADDDLVRTKIIINRANRNADFVLWILASQLARHGVGLALVGRAVVAGIVRTVLNRVKLSHKKIPFHILGD